MHLFRDRKLELATLLIMLSLGRRRIDEIVLCEPQRLPEEVQRLERILGHTLTLCIEQTEARQGAPVALLSGLATEVAPVFRTRV